MPTRQIKLYLLTIPRTTRLGPLSTVGRQRILQAAIGMKELRILFDLVLSKPSSIARELASLVALGVSGAKASQLPFLPLPREMQTLVRVVRARTGVGRCALLVGTCQELCAPLGPVLGSPVPGMAMLRPGTLSKMFIESSATGATGSLQWSVTLEDLAALSFGPSH